MINIIEQGDTVDYGVLSLVCDTEADLEDLKEQYKSSAKPGSTCLVIGSADVYMKNSENEWILL